MALALGNKLGSKVDVLTYAALHRNSGGGWAGKFENDDEEEWFYVFILITIALGLKKNTVFL
jgi:hypothetical protein